MAWVKVRLKDCVYLGRLQVQEESLTYTMYLTDLEKVWREELEEGQFGERWSQANQDLEGINLVDGLRELQGILPFMGQVSPEAGGTTGLQLAAQITDSQNYRRQGIIDVAFELADTFQEVVLPERTNMTSRCAVTCGRSFFLCYRKVWSKKV